MLRQTNPKYVGSDCISLVQPRGAAMQHRTLKAFLPESLAMQSAKRKTKLKRATLLFVLSIASTFVACSYITDFVVINESASPIEIRYKVKNLPGPFAPRIRPAKMTAVRLRAGDQAWQEMDRAQYELDPEDRTVTVRLMPNEALRIERLQRAGMQVDEAEDAQSFSVEELSIIGTNGEIKRDGERVRKSFVCESKKTYTLTYR
ncbi:MAG: hypothetical protein ACREBG_01155 [Pyrinomonadaceae bacterium]